MIILGTNSIKDTGYDVANSLRFDDGSSANLSETPSSTGNRRKFTFSTWLKRASGFGVQQVFFGSWNGNSDAGYTSLRFTDADQLNLTGWNTNWFVTSRKFRDPSAWYNIVLSIDTENGTAGNRMRLYINGVEETSFATNNNPNQNQDLSINVSGSEIYIASNEVNGTEGNYFDGYLAETVLIDGQQLAPDQFGEFDEDSGIWKPIDVSGLTFGTNGFYLDFENSGALGADVSGNSNNFTVNNLTAIDQSTDTCTNNFATLNPLYNAYVDPTFSEGNLKITQTSAWSGAKATMGVSTGKWYWEVKLTGTMDAHHHGVQQENVNESAQNPQNTTGTTVFANSDGGEMKTNGSATTSDYGTFSSGDIMGLALDMDAGSYGQITIYKNGSAIVSNFNLSSSSTTVMPFASIGNSTAEYNFGSPSFAISSGNTDGNGYGNFEYAVPNGYYSLNTKNLAEYG